MDEIELILKAFDTPLPADGLPPIIVIFFDVDELNATVAEIVGSMMSFMKFCVAAMLKP